jgi:hypothetical protein
MLSIGQNNCDNFLPYVTLEEPYSHNLGNGMGEISKAVLRNYLNGIEKAYRIGNATEHTCRSHLKHLLERLCLGVVYAHADSNEGLLSNKLLVPFL